MSSCGSSCSKIEYIFEDYSNVRITNWKKEDATSPNLNDPKKALIESKQWKNKETDIEYRKWSKRIKNGELVWYRKKADKFKKIVHENECICPTAEGCQADIKCICRYISRREHRILYTQQFSLKITYNGNEYTIDFDLSCFKIFYSGICEKQGRIKLSHYFNPYREQLASMDFNYILAYVTESLDYDEEDIENMDNI